MMVRTFDDITPAWLSEVLGVPVAEVRIEPLATGIGLLTSVARLHLTADGSAPDGVPRSLVVKLPSPTPANAMVVRRFRYDEREVGAYRDLLAGVDVPVPRCVHAEVDDDGFVVVLEDLTDHRPADQLAGGTVDQARQVAVTAARLHATWWADERLAHLEWLPGPTDPLVAGYGELFELTWPTFCAAHGDWLTAEHRRAAEAAMATWDEVIGRFATGPRTLVHGDLRLDNVLFGPDGAVALDWQLAARNCGPYDLAFFAAGSLEPEIQRWFHDEGVATYVDALGRADYTVDDARADYRAGHVLNLPNPVTAAVAVEPGNDRGRRLLEANARRALTALVDLGF